MKLKYCKNDEDTFKITESMKTLKRTPKQWNLIALIKMFRIQKRFQIILR